jgi:hypothetical protein
MHERGATESEVLATVETGERFAAPWGRTGFRKRFRAAAGRRGACEIAASAEAYDGGWLVVSVVVTSRARPRRTS